MAKIEDVLSSETKSKLEKVQEKWSDPDYGEDLAIAGDWRSIVRENMRSGDVNGMINDIAPRSQYNMIALANESHDEKIRFAANKFLLGQAGKGELQRVQHSHYLEGMSEDQLTAILKSKVMQIKRRDPDFDIVKLLDNPNIIEGEFNEVKSDGRESQYRSEQEGVDITDINIGGEGEGVIP